MHTIYLNQHPMHTFGTLPTVGKQSPDFELTQVKKVIMMIRYQGLNQCIWLVMHLRPAMQPIAYQAHQTKPISQLVLPLPLTLPNTGGPL